MVKATNLDSPQSGCDVTLSFGNAVLKGDRPHQHSRNISSCDSSQSSSTASTNVIADWGSVTVSSASSLSSSSSSRGPENRLQSDFGDSIPKWAQKDDLNHPNLSSGPVTSASSSDDFDDDERIKLLCGDNPEDWRFPKEPSLGQYYPSGDGGGANNNRRRRLFPKLTKVLHKLRRKFNCPLVLALAVILVLALSLSQFHDYPYRSVAIAGWNVNTSRDASVYLLPDQHTAIIEPRIVNRDKRYLLLVIVCSAVQNFNTRQTIRQTWGNGSEFNYEKYFHRMHSHAAHESYAAADQVEMQGVARQLFGPEERGTVLPAEEDTSNGYLIERLSSQVIFLVGRPQSNGAQQQLVVEESNAFGDVLQEDFVDTYNNLTLKSLMLLKWISRFNWDADRVKYVMKCDDDTFLNVPNLMHVLLGGTVPIYQDTVKLYTEATARRHSWTDSTSLMGFLFHNARPIRDVSSKWYAPRFMYRRKIFPNYLSGTGYVIEATQTAKELFKAALRTPIFHLEDVYVTGLCASRSPSTKPHHNPLFSFLPYANRKCALRGMITQHPLTSSDIRRAYERLARGNSSGECEQPPEEELRKLVSTKSGAQIGLSRKGVAWWSFIGGLVLLLESRDSLGI